jgi:hypothetical protein
VGCLIRFADVRLELDDPGNPSDGAVVADQPAAEQRPAELQCRQRQDVANRRRYRVLTGT